MPIILFASQSHYKFLYKLYLRFATLRSDCFLEGRLLNNFCSFSFLGYKGNINNRLKAKRKTFSILQVTPLLITMRQLVHNLYKSRSLKKLNPTIQLNKKFLILLMQTADIGITPEYLDWINLLIWYATLSRKSEINLGAAQQTIFPIKSKFSVKIV